MRSKSACLNLALAVVGVGPMSATHPSLFYAATLLAASAPLGALLIDADLARRPLSEALEYGDKPGLAELLRWFADNAQVARVMLSETGTVGAAAGPRFRQTFRSFTALLNEGQEFADSAPDLPNLASIAAGAVFARVYEEVTLGKGANLPQMLPELTFELLLPYLGEDSAIAEREAAAGQATRT